MAKPVGDLTTDELHRERHRCARMIIALGKGLAVKGLKKRLHEIERRISRQERGAEEC
jgi:hypothetical protein